MQKITPFMWFDNNAEEAMELYTRVFPDAKITNKSYYPEGTPGIAGQLMSGTFELFGQQFSVINGGPIHAGFTESISFFVECDGQDEVDSYWDQLIADGGEPSQCGWLKDKFGLSWQIIPSVLQPYLSDPDPQKAQRTMQAMLQMTKLDVAELTKAYNG